jgi:hypothetical protein
MKVHVGMAGLLVAMVAVTVLLAGPRSVAAKAQQPTAATAEVKVDNFSFGPGTLTVAVGTTVVWTNQGIGYRRKVLVCIYQGRNVSLLLFHSPEDDRQDCSAVTKR